LRPLPLKLQQIGWMAVIWTGSVMALGLVAMLIKGLMFAAGMNS